MERNLQKNLLYQTTIILENSAGGLGQRLMPFGKP